MRWHPARTTLTAIEPRYEVIRWRHRDDPENTRYTDQQLIRLNIELPLNPQYQLTVTDHQINQRIAQAMADIETTLTQEDLYADTEGLTVDVLIRINGKAWPAIPGLTAPAS